MPYETLNEDERTEFHKAVAGKHKYLSVLQGRKQNAYTEEEKTAIQSEIDALMGTSISADDFDVSE